MILFKSVKEETKIYCIFSRERLYCVQGFSQTLFVKLFFGGRTQFSVSYFVSCGT
jgi:hypothetical protein